MGTSTNGEISFGYAIEDGAELPWEADEYEGDIEEWWRIKGGYEPPFEVFTREGSYAPGFSRTDPRISEYFEHRSNWEKANPLPVELLNYCSGEYPMSAIAVPGTRLTCRRGYPLEFDPAKLVVTQGQIDSLKLFCETYGIEVDGEPKWLLTSYWG